MVTKTSNLLKSMKQQNAKVTPIGTDIILPNLSGDHSAGIVNAIPTNDNDIVNKKYVDDSNLWQRNTTTLSPKTSGDNILTTGICTVGGLTDTKQFIVKANASQSYTNGIFEMQDSLGNALLGVFTKPALYGYSASLNFIGGSKLLEQRSSPEGTDRMLYLPNGDRFEVLTENGGSYIAGFHGPASNLSSRIIYYFGFCCGDGAYLTTAPPSFGAIIKGNVGIGNIAPGYKLDVTGDINCSGVYRSGGTAGINATVTYVDTLLGAKTLTFTNGILTAQV